jgi:hypothetical protein
VVTMRNINSLIGDGRCALWIRFVRSSPLHLHLVYWRTDLLSSFRVGAQRNVRGEIGVGVGTGIGKSIGKSVIWIAAIRA